MSPRARGNGVRKVCSHGWRAWPKCPCPWYFSFKPRGGTRRYRFSLDAELSVHFDNKTDAEKAANTIREAILAGTFERRAERYAREQREAASRPADNARAAAAVVTFEEFTKTYIERAVQSSGKASWRDDRSRLAVACKHVTANGQALGSLPLTAITEDELEAFHAAQRGCGRAASTLNNYVQVLKAAFRWASRKGYLARSPISDDSALKRSKPAKRTRRVSPQEEAALVAVAPSRLQRLIIAAVETGMRLGELLDLTWHDVNLMKGASVITVRGETAKDGDVRLIPVSTRLAGFLEMAKTGPDGKEYTPERFVFGELGERLGSIKKSWETAVLKAHGVKPKWIGGKLSAGCREDLRRIDLHDLRREAGSRWHEGGFQLHEVRDLLGHANVSQTDTYLSARIVGLQEAMKRFDAARGKAVAKPEPIEQRPFGHDEREETPKDQLH